MARCTKIINADSEDAKYIINVKQFAKFVVDLAEQVSLLSLIFIFWIEKSFIDCLAVCNVTLVIVICSLQILKTVYKLDFFESFRIWIISKTISFQVASTDIEEGMRVGVDRNKYQVNI